MLAGNPCNDIGPFGWVSHEWCSSPPRTSSGRLQKVHRTSWTSIHIYVQYYCPQPILSIPEPRKDTARAASADAWVRMPALTEVLRFDKKADDGFLAERLRGLWAVQAVMSTKCAPLSGARIDVESRRKFTPGRKYLCTRPSKRTA
jgi:hypothetical protein